MTKPQFQQARIVDVLLLGPFMIWYAVETKQMPEWARVVLGLSGAATIWFNAANYHRQQRAARLIDLPADLKTIRF